MDIAPPHRPSRPPQPNGHTVLAWLLAAGAAVAVVKGTRIGPVVLVVSDTHGWGIHTGDALAVLPLLAVTIWQRSTRRPGRITTDTPPEPARPPHGLP